MKFWQVLLLSLLAVVALANAQNTKGKAPNPPAEDAEPHAEPEAEPEPHPEPKAAGGPAAVSTDSSSSIAPTTTSSENTAEEENADVTQAASTKNVAPSVGFGISTIVLTTFAAMKLAH